MGQGQSGLPAPGRRDKDNKKREASKKRKLEPPIPTRVGKKKKSRGVQSSNKLPQGKWKTESFNA
jgi:26S proteasome regulatory subunit T2